MLAVRGVNDGDCTKGRVGLVARVDSDLAAPAVAIAEDELGALLLQRLRDLDELGDVVRGVREPAEPLLELLLLLWGLGRELVERPGLVALEKVGQEHLCVQVLGEDVGTLLRLWLVAMGEWCASLSGGVLICNARITHPKISKTQTRASLPGFSGPATYT